MTPKNDQTSDEILAKLDQTSKKTRATSIALTLLLFLILISVAFLTYKAGEKYNDLNAETAILQNSIEDLSNKKAALRDEKDNLEKEKQSLGKAIAEAKDCLENNKNCAEAKTTLANVNTDVTTKPAITPDPRKSPSNASTTTNTVTSTNNSPSTVYIQIAEKTQRDSAKKIVQELAGGNFKFPGIELVERKVSQTQVRYFREEDKIRAYELVDELKKARVKEVVAVSPYKTNSPLEIWFSNDFGK